MAPTGGEDNQRLARALLVYVGQQFRVPANAICGFAEFLLEDARALDPQGARAADAQRIHAAGLQLRAMIEGLLEPAALSSRGAQDDFSAFRRRLQHDLRTPLNAIKGYAEMLLEDDQEDGQDADQDAAAAASGGDLHKLLEGADDLLARIDALAELALGAGHQGSAAQVDTSAVRHAIQSLAQAPALGPEVKGRILVVDDTAANRELLSRRLVRAGHEAVTVEDGARALQVLAAEPFDLILLDLIMPGLSGYEVLRQLKQNPRLNHLPVIMVSALGELDSIAGCIQAGAEDFLPKPCDPILLQARIANALEKKRLRDREQRYLAEIKAEKERSESLLLNILPAAIVARMQAGETKIADRFGGVSVLFADIVNFTPLSSRLSSGTLVELLNGIFSHFDRLALDFGVEKIKTIGDAYMAVAGLPQARPDHAAVIARLALAMREVMHESGARWGEVLQLRLGMHSGGVVAGVIGSHKFIYDIWGDTVNIASRMEAHGLPDMIQVSADSYPLLAEEFAFTRRGEIEVKGKGPMTTYFLLGPRA